MLTHEQLKHVIRNIYPQITEHDHGRKYWVAMPVDGDTQTGPAWIVQWNFEGIEPPNDDLIAQTWESVKDEYVRLAAAQDVRDRRDALLIEADRLVSRATDCDDAEALQAARAYRQALRDVPQQAGFPDAIEWPKP